MHCASFYMNHTESMGIETIELEFVLGQALGLIATTSNLSKVTTNSSLCTQRFDWRRVRSICPFGTNPHGWRIFWWARWLHPWTITSKPRNSTGPFMMQWHVLERHKPSRSHEWWRVEVTDDLCCDGAVDVFHGFWKPAGDAENASTSHESSPWLTREVTRHDSMHACQTI